VVAPERIDADRPDFIIIFPWNLRDEIAAQLEHARGWGARFVTAIPELQVW
jgi:ABC-type Fe3+-hydroxamate transport system substrate-binding protein